jgi:hypothetical protein
LSRGKPRIMRSTAHPAAGNGPRVEDHHGCAGVDGVARRTAIPPEAVRLPAGRTCPSRASMYSGATDVPSAKKVAQRALAGG